MVTMIVSGNGWGLGQRFDRPVKTMRFGTVLQKGGVGSYRSGENYPLELGLYPRELQQVS